MPANTVDIELDRPRQLLYNHNAMADLDMVFLRDFNKSILQIIVSLEKLGDDIDDLNDASALMDKLPVEMISFAGVRIFMWAGLKHEDRSLTLEQTGDLLEVAADKGTDITMCIMHILTAITKCNSFKAMGKKGGMPVNPVTKSEAISQAV